MIIKNRFFLKGKASARKITHAHIILHDDESVLRALKDADILR